MEQTVYRATGVLSLHGVKTKLLRPLRKFQKKTLQGKPCGRHPLDSEIYLKVQKELIINLIR